MQWIICFIVIGFFVSFKLVFEMVEKIHCKCMFFAFQVTFGLLKFHSIGYN